MIDLHQKPFIIPVFLPHRGCPHRCAFCNQIALTGVSTPLLSSDSLQQFIRQFLSYKGRRRSITEVAFYGGNFLGLQSEDIRRLLDAVGPFIQSGAVDGIRFSTRPDTISKDRLALVESYPVRTIELGVQSMDNTVLRGIHRCHSAQQTIVAANRVRNRGVALGIQLMVGLPGQDIPSLASTGNQVANLAPDFIRIYPTVVLRNSLLAKWYTEGRYRPLSVSEAVSHTAILYRIFRKRDIPVVRMGLQPTQDLQQGDHILAGPYHPAFGELVQTEVFFEAASDRLNALNGKDRFQRAMTIKVHPRSLSKMRGHGGANLGRLTEKFNLDTIRIDSDPSLSENDMVVVPSS